MEEVLVRAAGVVVMAMDLPIYFWPLTLALFAICLWCAYRIRIAGQIKNPKLFAGLLLSILYPIVIAIFAVHFWAEHPGATPETQEIPLNILTLIGLLYLTSLGVCIYLSRGIRKQMFGLFFFLVYINYSVHFVAGMAVSGIWL